MGAAESGYDYWRTRRKDCFPHGSEDGNTVASSLVLSELPVETLAEMANTAAEQVERHGQKTVASAVACGRALIAIKEQIEHGQWASWLGQHFLYSQRTASTYMALANSQRASNLTDATSVRQALRIVCEDTDEKPKKSEASVEVVQPDEPDEPGQPSVQPDAPLEKPQREPRKPPEPQQEKTPIATPEVFHLGERLDEDRSQILELSGDYVSAKKLKHFIVMIRKVATDLEAAS